MNLVVGAIVAFLAVLVAFTWALRIGFFEQSRKLSLGSPSAYDPYELMNCKVVEPTLVEEEKYKFEPGDVINYIVDDQGDVPGTIYSSKANFQFTGEPWLFAPRPFIAYFVPSRDISGKLLIQTCYLKHAITFRNEHRPPASPLYRSYYRN